MKRLMSRDRGKNDDKMKPTPDAAHSWAKNVDKLSMTLSGS